MCNPCAAVKAQYKGSFISKINCMGGAIGASVNGVLRPCLWMFPLKLIKKCYQARVNAVKNKKIKIKKMKFKHEVHAFSITFELSIRHSQADTFLIFCSPLLAWKHLIEINLFMVSGQIAINTGCQRSVALTSRGEAVLNRGLEQDITCLNIALLSEKWLL